MSKFVAIHRTSSPVDSKMLRHVLEQEGIPVRVTGMENPSNIGGIVIAEYRFDVPVEKVEEARAIVEAFLSEIDAEQEDLPWELQDADTSQDAVGEDEGDDT